MSGGPTIWWSILCINKILLTFFSKNKKKQNQPVSHALSNESHTLPSSLSFPFLILTHFCLNDIGIQKKKNLLVLFCGKINLLVNKQVIFSFLKWSCFRLKCFVFEGLINTLFICTWLCFTFFPLIKVVNNENTYLKVV